ncbi:glycoside hydrolase family 99-like domain-containing protein [Halocynthiibacter sp. C4]|uniref:glycoside hydrolase family 99-like domain-containing protein n=1 Tax=Halocynthiibacter sp. C4 TaxID=2992758 RepID=UPI00237B261C|nr:glycoside hydrolase family 99-like domain-containing protein [Halocynthiibacter sp. C4]MDE0591040.1 glycoside hydrolase family 99-like domain-containing protein [Halocynthiibacter sp. C4]
MSFQSRFARRLRIALQFFFAAKEDRKYIAKIKRSRRFDRTYYRDAHPHLHPLFKALPERHFALRGELSGYRPNPDFSPADYIFLNSDLAQSGVRAFEHFIDIGHTEGRPIQKSDYLATDTSVSPPVLRLPPQLRKKRFAICLHIYYPDLWAEFSEVLTGLNIEFDLYVSATHRGDETNRLFEYIRGDFPNAICFAMPNQGRDILPFVHLVNSGALADYDAICKIHTKKSPHRVDGDKWRRHLVKGLLDGEKTPLLLNNFLLDETAAIWVADGQHYKGAKWWGSNLNPAQKLLRRVEILPKPEALSFPAGSMYWLKPEMIAMIKGLDLTQEDFEIEQGQVDGTIAHAFERSIGYFAAAGGQEIRQTSQLLNPPKNENLSKPSYTSAFYLPQFHPTPENDAWWGKGFTEWASVVRAKPQFAGHNQPVLSSDLGFYDLRLPQTMAEQTSLARTAGIDAFCVYHYWFDGRRILETPLDNLLASDEHDFPFYLCWANESWRRNWDGLSGEVLLEQTYNDGFEDALVRSTLPYMRDYRYERPNGNGPRFIIYRPDDMPEPEKNIERMRNAWRKHGIGEVEIGAVRFHIDGANPIAEDAVDFWIEMPPHNMITGDDVLYSKGGPNTLRIPAESNFNGLIYNYNNLAPKAASPIAKNTIAGVMPSWDNTARRGASAHIAYGSNPQSFRRWLTQVRKHRLPKSYRNELFVNAWNEWAENAALEPNQKYGTAFLDTLKEQIASKEARFTVSNQIAAE